MNTILHVFGVIGDAVSKTLRRHRWLVLGLWGLVAWVVGFSDFVAWLLRNKVVGVVFVLSTCLAWRGER